MSNTTGSSSMMFNSSNRRARTKVQQDYAGRRVDALSIQSDMVRLSYGDGTGADVTFPYATVYGGAGYANIYTNAAGDVHPYASRLSIKGTMWDLLEDDTQIKYRGDATTAHFYATMTISQNAANKGVWGYTITGDGGTSYNSGVAPIVKFDNAGTNGSGATATTTITASGALESIVVTNPGFGYTSAPTITFVNATDQPYGSASATALISSRDIVQLAIYKKSAGDADFSLLNPETTGEALCNQNATATSNCTVSFMNAIAKNDTLELRVQTLSGGAIQFNVKTLVLSVRPIAMVGGLWAPSRSNKRRILQLSFA